MDLEESDLTSHFSIGDFYFKGSVGWTPGYR